MKKNNIKPEGNLISGKPKKPWVTSPKLLGKQQSPNSLFLHHPINHTEPPIKEKDTIKYKRKKSRRKINGTPAN